jgi:excisionase family DNA binding protein
MCENTDTSATGTSNNNAKLKNERNLLTVEQAAEQLAMSVSFIRKRIQDRTLGHVKAGGSIRIRQRDLDSFVDKGIRPAKAGC